MYNQNIHVINNLSQYQPLSRQQTVDYFISSHMNIAKWHAKSNKKTKLHVPALYIVHLTWKYFRLKFQWIAYKTKQLKK